ncbi:MAG: 23S rRNA (guanosine(2251)-2'-O)-methyltransferase RlmB [Legionellaceae bacterium]
MNETVYGLHAVSALLKNKHRTVYSLFMNEDRTDERFDHLRQLAKAAHIPLEFLSSSAMTSRFGAVPHQGAVAIAAPLPTYSERDLDTLLEKASLILILDGVTDPHNLGACLRSADAAGVDFVVLPKDNSANVTPAVSKVACGAAESVPLVRVANLARAMERIKEAGIWIYGAAGEADTLLYDVDCTSRIALALGAEGKGLRRLTRDYCDALFSLPMCGLVSSLNVSVATGICLYEVKRQGLVHQKKK